LLVTEYFQKIEVSIADCPNVLESQLTKDIRSLHVGIVEGMLTLKHSRRRKIESVLSTIILILPNFVVSILESKTPW
jgi:hypothetical protein